jgi:enamine deaminase RidA (YjgF/YER057c/UK114 family)
LAVSEVRVVQLFPADSAAPIPDGVRVNEMIYVPSLTGADPATGRMAGDAVAQMGQALENMRQLLERAGASLDNVGRVTGYVTRVDDREPIYGPWDAMFPDPQDRPAFKALVADLPKGVLLQLGGMHALVGGLRQRIDIPGVPARDPTVKIGNWVFSSRVHGTDPRTSDVPEAAEAQAECAFGNLRRLIELAGGNLGHITQITAFVRDPADGRVAENYLHQVFPDPGARPEFWALDAFIRPQLKLMLEMVAVL